MTISTQTLKSAAISFVEKLFTLNSKHPLTIHVGNNVVFEGIVGAAASVNTKELFTDAFTVLFTNHANDIALRYLELSTLCLQDKTSTPAIQRIINLSTNHHHFPSVKGKRIAPVRLFRLKDSDCKAVLSETPPGVGSLSYLNNLAIVTENNRGYSLFTVSGNKKSTSPVAGEYNYPISSLTDEITDYTDPEIIEFVTLLFQELTRSGPKYRQPGKVNPREFKAKAVIANPPN